MADNPVILLHPVREPLDQPAVGALELLARMMLPIDTAERALLGRDRSRHCQQGSATRVRSAKGSGRRG
jgi:hypothetical protein